MKEYPNMIVFQGRRDKVIIPNASLKHEERKFLENKNLSKDKKGNYWGCMEYLPHIFYKEVHTDFFDIKIPRYVQAFFSSPSMFFRSYEPKYISNLKEDIILFKKDLNALELNIEEFYNHLFNLNGIKIIYDENKKDADAQFDFNSNSMVFGRDSKKHIPDLDYFIVAFLHELYHAVEVNIEEQIAKSFNNGRWILSKRRVANTEKRIHFISWKNKEENASEQLAELLAALTYMRKPKIKELILPYHHSLCEKIFPNYMPLFPSEGLTVWEGH